MTRRSPEAYCSLFPGMLLHMNNDKIMGRRGGPDNTPGLDSWPMSCVFDRQGLHSFDCILTYPYRGHCGSRDHGTDIAGYHISQEQQKKELLNIIRPESMSRDILNGANG